MKKQLLTKTLLMAVMLLGGASFAWADAGDEITNLNLIFNGSIPSNLSYVLGTGEVANGNGSGQYWSPGVVVDTENKRLKLGNANLTFNLANTGEFQNKDIVTISYDVALGYSTKDANRDFMFYVFNSDGTAIITEKYNPRNSARHSSSLGFSRDDMYNPGNANTDWANKVHFEIVINYETGKISASSSCATAKNKTHEIAAVDLTEAQKKYIGSIKLETGNMNNIDHSNLVANLKVITTKGDYSTLSTITYAYEDHLGNDITDLAISKDAIASALAEPGDTYTPEYPTSFTDDEWAYDYTYVSGGESFEVTTDATITLVYTKSTHPTTDVTVQYKNGSSVLKSDVVHEDYPVGKATGYALRKYVLDTTNKELYQTSASMGTWRSPAAAATIEEAVVTTNKNNVVFFSEGEEIPGKYATGSSSIASRQSMGRFNSDTKICELEAGKYRFFAEMHCGNGTSGNVHAKMYVKAGSEKIDSMNIMARTNNQTLQFDFAISETKDILVNYAGGSNSGIDYIYIVKIADFATIGAKNYTTFASAYPLDCSDLPSGLTAYYVESSNIDKSNSKVTLTEATTAVAPGTGLLLKGDANEDYYIPVAATSGTDLRSTNKMIGCTTATTLTSTSPNVSNFYVLVNGATAPEFQNIATYVASNNVTIPAGKAYLDATGVETSRLSIVFGDEVTGIENLTPALLEGENVVYDLQGRRVMNAQKGLYIVNGKKVVIK